MKIFLSITMLFLLINCSNNENIRTFSFSYEVEVEPSMDKKLELWIPYPQSNEVQSITNIIVESGNLDYEIKN